MLSIHASVRQASPQFYSNSHQGKQKRAAVDAGQSNIFL